MGGVMTVGGDREISRRGIPARSVLTACWTGALEPTNEPYAIAKIAGIKMAEAYRSQYGSDFISVNADQSLRARRQLSS